MSAPAVESATVTTGRYRPATVVAALGLAAVLWSILGGGISSIVGLVVASASMPAAVLLAVAGRVELRPRGRATLGGAVVGALVALVTHGLVLGLAAVTLAGFAEAAIEVLDRLRVDPALTTVAGSPWTVVLALELVVVAPLTEELGKALGASLARPQNRRSAFLAGVAAGAGFAIVENVLYASGAGLLGAWEPVVLARMLGAAVHPLASGLVVVGWWEWRRTGHIGRLVGRLAAGVGVHALWNGSLVVLAVASAAYDLDGIELFGAVSLAYSAAVGTVAAAVLWRLAGEFADDGLNPRSLRLTEARGVAVWTIAAASAMVPVAMLVLAYPSLA